MRRLKCTPNHKATNASAQSATPRKIQAPTPWVRKRSGIPISVKVLNRVAAIVRHPNIAPILEPAVIKSLSVLVDLRARIAAIIKTQKYNAPRTIIQRFNSHLHHLDASDKIAIR